jgi:hypothetical protein
VCARCSSAGSGKQGKEEQCGKPICLASSISSFLFEPIDVRREKRSSAVYSKTQTKKYSSLGRYLDEVRKGLSAVRANCQTGRQQHDPSLSL